MGLIVVAAFAKNAVEGAGTRVLANAATPMRYMIPRERVAATAPRFSAAPGRGDFAEFPGLRLPTLRQFGEITAKFGKGFLTLFHSGRDGYVSCHFDEHPRHAAPDQVHDAGDPEGTDREAGI
jgi:hypothetical protein